MTGADPYGARLWAAVPEERETARLWAESAGGRAGYPVQVTPSRDGRELSGMGHLRESSGWARWRTLFAARREADGRWRLWGWHDEGAPAPRWSVAHLAYPDWGPMSDADGAPVEFESLADALAAAELAWVVADGGWRDGGFKPRN